MIFGVLGEDGFETPHGHGARPRQTATLGDFLPVHNKYQMLRTAEDDETEHEEETGDAPQPLKCKITFSPELIDTSNVQCCGPGSTSATRHQIEYGATQATEQHGAIWYLVHRRPRP